MTGKEEGALLARAGSGVQRGARVRHPARRHPDGVGRQVGDMGASAKEPAPEGPPLAPLTEVHCKKKMALCQYKRMVPQWMITLWHKPLCLYPKQA